MVKLLKLEQDISFYKWIPDPCEDESEEIVMSDPFIHISPEKNREESFNQGYLSAIQELQRHYDLQLHRQVDEVVENEKEILCAVKKELLTIKQQIEAISQNELVEFCFELVKHICRKLFEQDKEVIYSMIRHALNLMIGDSLLIKIFISKSTHESLMYFSQEMGEPFDGVQIMIDDKLSHGDFLIQSNLASINGLLEERLKKLKCGL